MVTNLTNVRQSITLKWDEHNVYHIDKHEVTKLEVEEACLSQIYVDVTYANRLMLVGKTSLGRMLSVVLARVGKNKYYVVTARDSSRGERKKVNDKEKSK
jgi:uncharacterized DUF497 family protein